MQIKINLKIFIFLLIFLITRQIKIYAFLMLFAFIHELGHMLAGIIMGFRPKALEIAPYGFSISFNRYDVLVEENKFALKKIFIAFAGPATNLLIILITSIYSLIVQNYDVAVLEMIMYSNILIFIFNMLPIYPLDGGRIIKEITYIWFGEPKSCLYTNKVSKICVIMLTAISSFGILIYKNIAILVIIVYLWIIVIRERQKICN